MAIARELLPMRPPALVISALTQREAREGGEEVAPPAPRGGGAPEGVELLAEWGNLFVPRHLKDEGRDRLLDDPAARGAMLDDLYGALGEEALRRSSLGDLILRHQPDAVIDCVNTATGFAYQNV